jgi:hypothetical protein
LPRAWHLFGRFVALGLALPMLCAFQREHAETDGSGPCVYWPSREPHFSINMRGSSHLTGPGQFTAVQNGFAAWSAPSCTDMVPQYDGTTTRTDVGYDPAAPDASINLIVFRPDLCSAVVPDGSVCLDEPGGCDDAFNCLDDSYADGIAITHVFSVPQSGSVLSAGIELNDRTTLFSIVNDPVCDPRCSWPDGGDGDGGCAGLPLPPLNTVDSPCVATDVWNAVAHESGHFLGFAHTDVPDAVMFPTIAIGDTNKRVLHPDDQDGVCTVYPRGGPTSTVCPGYSSGGCGCQGGTGASVLTPLALIAWLLAWRGRPRFGIRVCRGTSPRPPAG